MAKLQKSIFINALVEKVFAFLDEPANLPSIWPALEAISDVERLQNGGTSSRFIYRMGGLRVEGHSETIEYVPNQRAVTRSKGGIESTLRWLFQAEGAGTRLTFEAEYTVPIPLLGKIAEAILVRQNEQEAETILANLKARMEA
jgi:uncharacterized membrane protein